MAGHLQRIQGKAHAAQARSRRVLEVLRKHARPQSIRATIRRAYRGWQMGGVGHLAAHARWQVSRLEAEQEYQRWTRSYDTPTPGDRRLLFEKSEALKRRPSISVLMPVFAEEPRWLQLAIDSIIDQIYPHWELCLVDDASPSAAVRDLLRHYADTEPRIKLALRSTNGHICVASNDALTLASADYIALVDHDDVIPCHALYAVAEALNRHDADIIYSDEDKIDERGRRFDPYFKPDWNLELCLGQNLVSHLGVYRRSLVQEVGGFRPGYEGSQDWDLVLRAVERSTPEAIHHIPHVLYHWRVVSGSTAGGADEKPYAGAAARRAVRDHLRRTKTNATVTQLPNMPTWNRVKFESPSPLPTVTVIVPMKDRADLLRPCAHSLLHNTRYPAVNVVIVDNGSREAETLALLDGLAKDERVRVIRWPQPFNFARMHNDVITELRSDLICLLNNDIVVDSPDWLDAMVSVAYRPGVAAVGAMLYHRNETVQHAGIVLGMGGVAAHPLRDLPRGCPGPFGRAALLQEVSAATGACLLVKTELFRTVGGFDDRLAVAYNDVDLCLRLRAAGHRIVWSPDATLHHHESATRHAERSASQRERLGWEAAVIGERWGQALFNDPFYNPNLSLSTSNYGLSFPPREMRVWDRE